MKEMLYPPYLQWEVTPKCNHNCIHCYNYWRQDGEEMPECTNFISIAEKIVERKPVTVTITGGEPLLVFESIKASILLLRKAGIIVSLNTNATLVTTEIAEFLARNNVSCLVSFPCYYKRICDEITHVDGSFNRIVAGIKTLVDNGVMVTVNMVVSKKNIDYIYGTARYAKDKLGVTRFFASRVSKPINSKARFDKYLLSADEVDYMCRELIRVEKALGITCMSSTPIPACTLTTQEGFLKFAYERSCTAGKSSYSLDCLGNIKACPRDSEIYGNILVDDFKEVWAKMEPWRDGSFIPDECKKCEDLKKCHAGCRLDAYPKTGEKKSLDPAACLDRVPVWFKKHPTYLTFKEDDKFELRKGATWVKENVGWRVNVGRDYIQVTDAVHDFLSEKPKFCFETFWHHFDQDRDRTNQALSILVKKNIVEYKDQSKKQILNKKKGVNDYGSILC